MGRINLVGMCRGEGHGYALLSSMDTSLTPVVRAHTADGRAIRRLAVTNPSPFGRLGVGCEDMHMSMSKTAAGGQRERGGVT